MRAPMVAAALALAATACAPATEGRPEGVARAALIGGHDSDATHDAVVLVLHYDALKKSGAAGCTGTMVAPNLVLTARHCVADSDPTVACRSDGTVIAGGKFHGNFTAAKLYAFAGVTRPDFLAGGLSRAARGVEIFDDGGETICGHDLALLLLDRALPGAKIAPVRLEGGPVEDEALTLLGWGVTDETTTPETRKVREAAKVLEVGPGTELTAREFRVGEGGCAGDSGGPALAASGAVVGTLSRGGNGTGAEGADGCIHGENVYSSVASFADLLGRAYERAGRMPWTEGQPNPNLAPVGGACGNDAECRSGVCDAESAICASSCEVGGCDEGFTCADRGGRKLCVQASVPLSEPSHGCAVGRSGAPSLAGVVVVVTMLAFVFGRRRKDRDVRRRAAKL